MLPIVVEDSISNQLALPFYRERAPRRSERIPIHVTEGLAAPEFHGVAVSVSYGSPKRSYPMLPAMTIKHVNDNYNLRGPGWRDRFNLRLWRAVDLHGWMDELRSTCVQDSGNMYLSSSVSDGSIIKPSHKNADFLCRTMNHDQNRHRKLRLSHLLTGTHQLRAEIPRIENVFHIHHNLRPDRGRAATALQLTEALPCHPRLSRAPRLGIRRT